MDFSDFTGAAEAHEAGREVRIIAPDGTETDAVWTVAGPLSKAYRRGKIAAGSALRRMSDDAAEEDRLDAFTVAGISRCVIGWTGVEWEKKPLDCTPENAAMLMTRFPWVAEQVERAIHDEAGFTKA